MGNTTITPRLGQIVLYTLTDADVREIIHKRRQAGQAIRSGNDVREGDTYPAIVVRDWIDKTFLEKVALGEVTQPDGTPMDYDAYRNGVSVNLQVFLDGNDTYWATSRTRFDPERNGRIDPDAPDFYYGDRPANGRVMDQALSAEEVEAAQQEWQAAYDRAFAQYRAEWFRPDHRGTWTDEPIAW